MAVPLWHNSAVNISDAKHMVVSYVLCPMSYVLWSLRSKICILSLVTPVFSPTIFMLRPMTLVFSPTICMLSPTIPAFYSTITLFQPTSYCSALLTLPKQTFRLPTIARCFLRSHPIPVHFAVTINVCGLHTAFDFSSCNLMPHGQFFSRVRERLLINFVVSVRTSQIQKPSWSRQ
jgi:hypothetical protein